MRKYSNIMQRKNIKKKSLDTPISTKTKMDIDTAYTAVGQYGKFHRKLFWGMSFIWLYLAFHQIHNIFLAVDMDFICVLQDNKRMDGCPPAGKCSHIIFQSNFTSIVSEWDLVCSRSYMASSVQSYYFVGVLLSNLIFGGLADRYGRKRMIWLTCVLSGLFSLFGALSTQYWIYCVMRFLCGIFSGGLGLVGFVMLTEMVPKDQNSFIGTMLPCIFAAGIPVFSFLAYNIVNWRILTIVTSLPGLFGLYYYWFVPESPRWLYTKGRYIDAERVLYKMFKANNPGRSTPDMTLKHLPDGQEPSNVSAMKIFTNKVLLRRSLLSLPSWAMFTAIYYGMTMSAGSLGDNRFISVSLSGLVEIPANLFAMAILDRLGRRWTFGGFMLLTAIPCFGILLYPNPHTATTVALSLLGKMSVSAASSIAYIFVAELYPTVVRNSAVGICSTAAVIGSVAAPLITPLGQYYPAMDYLIYGVMALLSGMLTLQLPDTTGKPMPETLDDLNQKSLAN